jgi:hypothetical protein
MKGTDEWWVGQYGDGRVRVECPSPQKPNGKGKEKAVDGDRSRETRSSSLFDFLVYDFLLRALITTQ